MGKLAACLGKIQCFQHSKKPETEATQSLYYQVFCADQTSLNFFAVIESVRRNTQHVISSFVLNMEILINSIFGNIILKGAS